LNRSGKDSHLQFLLEALISCMCAPKKADSDVLGYGLFASMRTGSPCPEGFTV